MLGVNAGRASVHSDVNCVPANWQRCCRGKAEASHSRCGLSFPLRWQINLCPWSVNYCPSQSQPSTASLCTLCQRLPHSLYSNCLTLRLSPVLPLFHQSFPGNIFPFFCLLHFVSMRPSYFFFLSFIMFFLPLTMMSRVVYFSVFFPLPFCHSVYILLE